MAKPWTTLERVATDEGVLELRQRDRDDFLIVIDGRVLMSSRAHRSEIEVATLALARCGIVPNPRVLIGGLGMAYTLRAALDRLPQDATVVVAELNEAVVRWCEGPLAPLTGCAVADPRVRVELADVADLIKKTERTRRWTAIILDLYEGPHAALGQRNDPIYGAGALGATRHALDEGGVFSVWSEERDAPFERRLTRAGFQFDYLRSGKGGRRHPVYIATTTEQRAARDGSGRSPLRKPPQTKRKGAGRRGKS